MMRTMVTAEHIPKDYLHVDRGVNVGGCGNAGVRSPERPGGRS
jgi:hypothetical protein